jgi:hypothetical protein
VKPHDEDAPRDEATEVIERPVITPPDTYVSLTAAAPPSDLRCGRDRIVTLLGDDHGLDEPAVEALTQPCLTLSPGATTTVTVRFVQDGKPARPSGTLRLEPTRGRLERTRFELDGERESVEVGYKAPDETVRVSVRAFLDGFGRGKLHLHLE